MKKIIQNLTLYSILLTATSCEEVLFNDSESNDPVTNFEYMWRQCHDKYSFFTLKNIDWNKVHDRYRPMVDETISNDSLFNVLSAMLNELRDGHVNLVSAFNVSHYDIDLKGPENVNFRVVRENYLASDYLYTGPFAHTFLDGNQVGYILYPSFANNFSEDQLDYIFRRYVDTKGLIIDLRSNGGGNPDNIYKIIDRLAENKTLLFNSYLKNGSGPYAFSAPLPSYAWPSERPGFKGKVVVLTNRGSYSAASFFVLAARALPNCTIVGDITGGGLGLPNGGQMPNGWTYRFSVSQTITPEGENFENGIPPDVFSFLSESDEAIGIDTVIEDAIDLLQ